MVAHRQPDAFQVNGHAVGSFSTALSGDPNPWATLEAIPHQQQPDRDSIEPAGAASVDGQDLGEAPPGGGTEAAARGDVITNLYRTIT